MRPGPRSRLRPLTTLALMAALSVAAVAAPAGAQAAPAAPPRQTVELHPAHLACRGALALTGEAALLEQASAAALDLRLPLPDSSQMSLLLHPRNVLAPGARVVVGYADGDVAVDPPAMRYFAGTAADDPESLIVLGVQADSIQGLLVYRGRTYSLSTGPHGADRPLVVADLAALPADAIRWAPFECGVKDLLDGPLTPPPARPAGGRNDWPCRIVKVAVDSDWEFTDRFDGDTDASAAYALLLMTANAEMYSRDLNLGVEVSYLRMWGDANDPWDADQMGPQLEQFRDYWNANMQGVERNVAQFVSTRPLGGGVAWVSVVCNQYYGYSVAANMAGHFPYPLVDHSHQNWDIMVSAHELGHNCGAPHTHDLNPPADGCGLGDCSSAYGGTIMSYCHTCPGGMHNLVMRFHERIVDEAVVPYFANLSCVQEFQPPLILGQPQPWSICAGKPTVFSVNVSSNHPLTYQWRKDGEELPEHTEATMIIMQTHMNDAGSYDVLISNGCQTIVSDAATLSVHTIAGDLTGDGSVTQGDLGILLATYELTDDGDVDGDGDTDQSDLGILLASFGAACE